MLSTDRLESSFAKKDLEVLVNGELNTSQQCGDVTKKASSLLGCINKSVTSGWREVILSP